MNRAIGLSAQAIPGCEAWRLIELARIGGFDSVGLGIDPAGWSTRDSARVRRSLADNGVLLQDVEVIRLQDRVTEDMRRLIDIAADLGAGWIIAISLNDDASATRDMLAEIASHGTGSDTAPILEFGRFTSVGSLAAARSIAEAAGVAILVDPLHLARCGDRMEAVADLPAGLLPYAQMCDAGPPPVRSDPAGLLEEARDHRENLGHGVLDLHGFVAALPPGTPLMNEVRSRAIAAAWPDPEAHARHLGETMRHWLDRRP